MGAVFDSCRWAEGGLQMMTFPFLTIAELSNCVIAEADLRGIEVRCRITSVKFERCTWDTAIFAGAPIQSLEIEGLPRQSLVFMESSIHNIRLTDPPSKTTQRPKLAFKANCSIDSLLIERAKLDGLELVELPNLRNVRISEVKVSNGKTIIRQCVIDGFEMFRTSMPEIAVEDVTWQGRRRIIECLLPGGNWRRGNVFEHVGDEFVATDLSGSTFEQLAVRGDFSKLRTNRVTLANAYFRGCNFTNANLDGCDFDDVTFDSQCDMRGIRNGRITDSNFSRARLLANIDNLRFEAGEFQGTLFAQNSKAANAGDMPVSPAESSPLQNCMDAECCLAHSQPERSCRRRRLTGCSFHACTFSADTCFNGLCLHGGGRQLKMFEQCRTWDNLVFNDVVFHRLKLENFSSQNDLHFTLDNCMTSGIELQCNSPRLRINCSEITTLVLKSANIAKSCLNINGSTIHILDFRDSKVENITVSRSVVKLMTVIDTSMNSVGFNSCLFGAIDLRATRRESTADAAPPPKHGASTAPSPAHDSGNSGMYLKEVVFNDVLLCDTLFNQVKQERNLRFTIENIPKENCDITLRYFNRVFFCDEQVQLFQEYGVKPDRKGNEKDFFAALPIGAGHREATTALRNLLVTEIAGLDDLRHTGDKFDPALIRANATVFSALRMAIMQRDWLLSTDTTSVINRLSFELERFAHNNHYADPTISPEQQYMPKFREMMELMTMRISRRAEGSALRSWICQALKGETGIDIQISAWPEHENRRLYADFGLLTNIIARIAKNINDHAPKSQISLHGEIDNDDLNNTACREVFSLRISDNGQGWGSAAQDMTQWAANSRLGKLLTEFGRRYCRRILVGTTNAKGEQVAIELCGESVKAYKPGWFSGGTAYQFQIWKPVEIAAIEEEILE